MPKRFHDTEIWDEDWFIRLPNEYRQFWFYVKDQCDHAGIWRPNVDKFNRLYESTVVLDKAFKLFNDGKERLIVLESGRWFITGFIPFQYGRTLNLQNRLHNSIYQALNYFEVNLRSIYPQVEVIEGPKNKRKDKDKDKDKEIELDSIDNVSFDHESEFQKRWERYPSKDGRKEAFKHFNATVTPENISDLDKALDNYLHHLSLPQNSFKHPKNGKTWFNNWQDWINWKEPEHRGGRNVTESIAERKDRERRERDERVFGKRVE